MSPDGRIFEHTGAGAAAACFHCAKPVETPVEDAANGGRRTFCSPVCRDIARGIEAAGLGAYYDHREAAPDTGGADTEDDTDGADAALYDDAILSDNFVRRTGDGASAAFLLEGVSCSACLWLIEQTLRKIDGIRDLRVDSTARQVYLLWDPDRVRVSDILGSISSIGFRAYPFDPTRREALQAEERRRSTERLLFAGLLMMPVMGFQVSSYWIGAEPDGSLPLYQEIGRWFVLAITSIILVYSGRDFFHGALRDLRQRRAGMDVPIVLGLSIAWGASAWATATASGHTYFDSIVMFVFFVLAARTWELSARRQAGAAVDRLFRIMPRSVTRLTPDGAQDVLVQTLAVGDRIRLSPGETVPVDATLMDQPSSFDESVMTGESRAVIRQPGEMVMAGACNIDQAITLTVARARDASTLAEMHAMMRRGMAERPGFAVMAERIAPWFVTAVLLIAAGTAGVWAIIDPAQILDNTIAVLIVTCPCALALATPVALAVSAGRLSGDGILAARMAQIEPLARADLIVFDKTGTLTLGRPELVGIATDKAEDAVLARAAALEAGSEHPLARAVVAAARARGLTIEPAGPVRNHPGAGVEANLDGARWRMGTFAFAGPLAEDFHTHRRQDWTAKGHTLVLLSQDGVPGAVFAFADTLRPGAGEALRALEAQGRQAAILSGDRPDTVARFAQDIGLAPEQAAGDMTPAAKLDWVQARQASGRRIVMLGDGINDAPVLSAADVSVSLADGTELARQTADFVILSNDMKSLSRLMGISRRTVRIIRQNLFWALSYNILAVPAAAAGFIPPWAAAIGMSASSFLVVGNALRLKSH